MPTPRAGYKLKDGSSVPGTTTIIGRFKDSGGLLFWAFAQGKSGKARLYEESEAAADVGTLAHAMVEAHIKKRPEVKPPEAMAKELVEKAENAFLAYLTWEKQTHLHILATEVMLVSEQHRFGGTPDAIGEMGDEMCLLDWKTSNAVYTDHLIQVAAYRALWEENYPEQRLTGGFHILRFAKEHGDFAHHHYPNLDEAWRQFLLFREAFDIDKALKKRAA